MHIGVSGWRLAGQPLGVSRYTEYVLKHWHTMLQPSDSVTVFVTEPIAETRRAIVEGYNIEVVKPRLTNALWENLLLPQHTRKLDVLFGPSYTLPLRHTGRTVVAIHSTDEVGKRFPSWRAWPYEQKYKWSARRADRVIANAHVVKDGIIRSYGVAPEKVDVVWLAAGEAFRPLHDEELNRATRRRFVGGDRPYILFVGGMSKRRNVPVLMEALSILKKSAQIPHALLLVGPNRASLPIERLASQLGIADSVVHTDGKFSSHQDLVAVYNAADAFCLPSSSEGFSLTTAEAMACGVPVVTINRAGLGEMAHGYGLTIEEPSAGLLAEALRSVTTDADVRRQIGARCLERSKVFSWDITARRALEILREVAAS